MGSIGVNIARDGSTPVQTIRSFGATWVRVVGMPDLDLSQYFLGLRSAGIKILLVLARESGGDYARYQRMYGSLVDAAQVGNEPDLESPSSWTMTAAELTALGKTARAVFPHPFPLVGAGLASGHPEWLQGADLSPFDALAFHPYLKDAPNPGDLEDLQDVDTLIPGYAAYGKPLLITEWGWWSDDERRATEETRDMTRWAGQTGDIEVFFYFCASDAMVPPFGLLRASGSEKPRAKPFREEAANAIHSLWPDVQAPPMPEPLPPPALPDPWQWWSAPSIAQAAQCPLDAVRDNWPRLTEQLHHCGLTDPNIWLGMIGTIAIESASTFRPVREAYYLGEPEPAETYRKTLRYYPYYGRGFIQNTWESNYRALGRSIAELWGAGPDDPTFDLVARPDNLLDPDMSAAAAALYFRDHGGGALAEAARAGNWSEVRRLVLGGPDAAGVARITQIATTLGPPKPTEPTPTPPPASDDPAPYILALKTLRDETLPAAMKAHELEGKALQEALRICEQMVGPRS